MAINQEDFLSKIGQIEEHARLTLEDYPNRDLVKERQRMIIALTKFIRTEISLAEYRAIGAALARDEFRMASNDGR